MAAIASILGFRSSRPEISDDEASVASEAHTPVKAEKKTKKEELEEEALKVESDGEEGGEDDDEVGEDECVHPDLRVYSL